MSRLESVPAASENQMKRTYCEGNVMMLRLQPITLLSDDIDERSCPIRLQNGVTDKTWTPILVVKGVYYKSFLPSVVVCLNAREP